MDRQLFGIVCQTKSSHKKGAVAWFACRTAALYIMAEPDLSELCARMDKCIGEGCTVRVFGQVGYITYFLVCEASYLQRASAVPR